MGALINDAPIILLDDPLRALDVHSYKLILELFQYLKSLEKTIVLTTHFLQLAENVCDIIAFMKNGQFLDYGPHDQIKTNLNCNSLTDAYLKIYEKEFQE